MLVLMQYSLSKYGFYKKDPIANPRFKEVDIGLAADTGSLNRLPKIGLSDSWVRELSYTGRLFGAKEALEHGNLV